MIRLKELRIKKGLNMRQIALALDMPYTTYVNYEKGAREPNSEMLIAFATFYDVSIDYLIGFTDDPKRSGGRLVKAAVPIQSNTLTTDENELVGDYRQLNTDGKGKAREYTSDLTTIDKYTAADADPKDKIS